MGHGLNMQYGGRRMVMFSVTWNLEHYAQVISRILRRGLEGDMWLHRLLVRGTRDMKVRARLGTKQTNQQFLMNEVKELMNKYDLT
jgi:SNF2 family DNA or RNA helicase